MMTELPTWFKKGQHIYISFKLILNCWWFITIFCIFLRVLFNQVDKGYRARGGGLGKYWLLGGLANADIGWGRGKGRFEHPIFGWHYLLTAHNHPCTLYLKMKKTTWYYSYCYYCVCMSHSGYPLPPRFWNRVDRRALVKGIQIFIKFFVCLYYCGS